MKLTNFIESFVTTVKTNIIELAKTELSNENKKLALDYKIYGFIDDALERLSINFILKFALKKILLPNVSLFTQLIFNLLKSNIEGITK